jgi:hypothetical protein
MGPAEFRGCLATTVKELSLAESNWKAAGWQKLWGGISQEILKDAFNQHDTVHSLFATVGAITQRSPKPLARVQKKMTEQTPGRENFFKVVSDFVAARVSCEVTEIQAKIDRIREIVLANGGVIHIRGSSSERPYGFYLGPDKKYTDITQFVYVFLEKVGYPIEFQIGHPFAHHTFTIDSALRDDPTCGKVDLWKNNFYNDVKKYLLDQANGQAPAAKDDLLAKAAALHDQKTPQELNAILSRL